MSKTIQHREVFEALSDSDIYRDYKDAFTKATGLPLSLEAPGENELRLRKSSSPPPFCALMAKTNVSCGACYALQRQLEESAKLEPKTLKCFAGLCETAVPVRIGENLIAFLHTGHVLVDRPEKAGFRKIAKELERQGSQLDLKQAEEAWFATRVLSAAQYDSLVRLLGIFAKHLASCGNQLALRKHHPEPAAVERAREIIELNHEEELSLAKVAGSVNVSTSYFSEIFKKATGINFVEYVARLRVEKARNLLQNPDRRISEVAFEVGFQSLSQFNRAFKKHAGMTPSAARCTEV